MSDAASSKRPSVTPKKMEAKRPRLSSTNVASSGDAFSSSACGFGDLPDDCRLRILSLLDADDLTNASQVSHIFYKDCRHSSLPQTRTAVVSCCTSNDYGNSFVSLLYTLLYMNQTGKFARFTKLRLLSSTLLDKLTVAEARKMTRQFKLLLRGVTSLDLSVSHVPRKTTSFRMTLPKALAFILPDLQRLDLSNTRYAQAVLLEFSKKCPLLECISWNQHCTSTHATGQDMKHCHNLKELRMDNSTFYCGYSTYAAALWSKDTLIGGNAICIMYFCKKKLERVSLKNAKCYIFGKDPLPIPQEGLIKFVRLTPTLRWFRSDLTPANVGVLKTEFPLIEFE